MFLSPVWWSKVLLWLQSGDDRGDADCYYGGSSETCWTVLVLVQEFSQDQGVKEKLAAGLAL